MVSPLILHLTSYPAFFLHLQDLIDNGLNIKGLGHLVAKIYENKTDLKENQTMVHK